MARCEDCIHYGVCIELERYRDPLWFTNTKDEFCCSSYLAADVAPRAEVAREIFEEIEELFRQHKEGGYYLNCAWYPERLDLDTEDAFAELKKKYTEGEK